MDYNVKQKKKKNKKALKFWSIFFLLILCIALAIWLFLRNDTTASISIIPPTNQGATVVAGEQTFSNQYFEFTVSDDWIEIGDDQKRGDFYQYSQYGNNIPQRHIRIYVNPTNNRYQTSFILPVKIVGSKISPENQIPEHCRKQGLSSYTVSERTTIQGGVTFLCDVDSTTNKVSTGLIGGGFELPYKSEANGDYSLIIEYNDVGIYRDDRVFIRMLDSFRFK